MQDWQGKRNAVLGMYTRIEDPVDDIRETLEETWNDVGAVPMISWWTATQSSGRGSNALIAQGAYDTPINSFVAMLRLFLAGPDGIFGNRDDRRLFFRPAWEPNGDWSQWSPNYAPLGSHPPEAQYRTNVTDFKAMWAHIHDRFEAQGLESDHVQWIYSVNFEDSYRAVPGTSERSRIAEDIYPGDAYVDWLGISAHNFSTALAPAFPWKTPFEIMEPMLHRLHQFRPNLPLALPEMSTTSAGATLQDKAGWISQYASYLRDPSGTGRFVRMAVYFNQNNPPSWRGGPPSDWAVFSEARDPYEGDADESVTRGATYHAHSAYRKILTGHAWFTGSDTGNPRLLTDAQFRGD